MENASKALIIAGAILISILLISIGILIFNSVKATTNQATPAGDIMSLEATIAKIDMQFSKYNGVQNGATVKQILEEVAVYNDNNGVYDKKGDEDTTGYRRKISVCISNHITGDKTASNIEAATIRNYCNKYFNNKDDTLYKVIAVKRLDPSEGKAAIYTIFINPN